jgi:hypothetical protein
MVQLLAKTEKVEPKMNKKFMMDLMRKRVQRVWKRRKKVHLKL